MEKVLNNMFLGDRKQWNWFQFHLPTVKSVKALLLYCDFAFQNCNTVTVTQKKSFSKTVICYLFFETQKNRFRKMSTVKL